MKDNNENTLPAPVEEPCKRCGQEPYPEATRECIKRGTGECELARRATQPAERPTPITDEAVGRAERCMNHSGAIKVLGRAFRDLERQLADAREQRDRLADALRTIRQMTRNDQRCSVCAEAYHVSNAALADMKGNTDESR